MHSKILSIMSRHPGHSVHNALSEHVVFHSPVRDYHGHADVAHILITIGDVLDSVDCQREMVAGCQVVTIITATHAHHRMNGVLHETFDGRGRVEQATLLLRPLSTLLEAITAMRAALDRSPLPSTLATLHQVNHRTP